MKKTLITLIAAAILPFGAYAQKPDAPEGDKPDRPQRPERPTPEAMVKEIMAKYDIDKDQKLSSTELLAYFKERTTRFGRGAQGRRGGGAAGAGREGGRRQRGGAQDAPEKDADK